MHGGACHTLIIFKSLLDERVIDVGVNLQLLQIALHAGQTLLLLALILGADLCCS